MKKGQSRRDVLVGGAAGIAASSLGVAQPGHAQQTLSGAGQDALPFPRSPSASVAGSTLEESKHRRRVELSRLPADAPNILIILLDDVGFGQPDTYGGPIHTPTLSRIADQGVSYSAFHTTAICSPTRAALLTGRNHHRVGSGTIAERAVDWDGYTGVIPRTSATLAKVLGYYGYKSAAFGKWHDTPAVDTTAMGPFTLWPTGEGIGFDYFYGFLAGETSQWEPRLVENLNPVEPPHDDTYHLSEDLADKAVAWLRRHRAYAPDMPFFMYLVLRRVARTASHLQGLGRQVQRQVRRRDGMRCASASLRARRGLAGSRPSATLRCPTSPTRRSSPT